MAQLRADDVAVGPTAELHRRYGAAWLEETEKNTVLSLLDRQSRTQPLMTGDTERLRGSLYLLIGFFGGCVVGAVAVSWLGDWAWSFPVALAAVAVRLPQGDEESNDHR